MGNVIFTGKVLLSPKQLHQGAEIDFSVLWTGLGHEPVGFVGPIFHRPDVICVAQLGAPKHWKLLILRCLWRYSDM